MAHDETSTLPQDDLRQESAESREPAETRSKLSRRNLLTAGGAATAAIVLQGCPKEEPTTKPETGPVPGPYVPTSNNFPQPKVIHPNANGDALLGDVHVHMSPFTSCASASGEVRSYEGHTPGPTIVVDPGGKIGLTLYNDLPANPGAPNDTCGQPDNMNTPHCFNTTNLHTHGLHVSPCSVWDDGQPDCGPPWQRAGQPKLASDDVLIEIEPGHKQEYCIQLPKFHAPGTHWYHSHKHGSTAIQVANGMAGALIVREANPLVDPENDYVWLIQEALPNSEDYKIYPGFGAPPSVFYINGECGPTLQTHTGKTLRLRFINATGTPQGMLNLKIVKCANNTCPPAWPAPSNIPNTPVKSMYLMAVDGITFFGNKPQEKASGWVMAGGNRADFLVQFDDDEVGTYMVLKDVGPGANFPPAAKQQVLGYIKVDKGYYKDTPPQDVPLPPWSDAPAYLQPIQRSEVTGPLRTIEFQNPAPQDFRINDFKYRADPQFDIREPLGCTRAWNLKNTAGAVRQAIAHPFHIHINPFQLADAPNPIKLVDQNGPDVPENWIWWDTINIPVESKRPQGLILWTRFWDYPGRFVLHCHILVHEDIGMMANVRVEDPDGAGAQPCQELDEPIEVDCQTLPDYP